MKSPRDSVRDGTRDLEQDEARDDARDLQLIKLNAELSASESRYRFIYENAQVGMYRTKLDGSAFLAANPMLAEITGLTLEITNKIRRCQ